MCGIAGVIDLEQRRLIDRSMVHQMSEAMYHRGPDEQGELFEPGIALASRRLSIIDLADGQQPMFNEDRSVAVVYNGELFDHVEVRHKLQQRGHQFRTQCDTEILVHLWEEYGERMFDHVRGQFAFALYDYSKQLLIFARDRTGICPFHWATKDGLFYFGSEIKSILASGEIQPQADLKGLNHIFTLFAMPSRRTAFRGIHALPPGHYLKIQLNGGDHANVSEHKYWDLDFPDWGDEYTAPSGQLVEEFHEVFQNAVRLRLRADVPVVSYLSGGVDSAIVMAMASEIRNEPVPSFTIKIASKRYDEESKARAIAQHFGSEQTVVTCDSDTLSRAYYDLIGAADCPVVDTACAALYCLAAEVRRQGYKVALTGEGADEALAGYPWFKINRLLKIGDVGQFRPSMVIRQIITMIAAPHASWSRVLKDYQHIGGPIAPADLYVLLSGNRSFFSADAQAELADHSPFHDLKMDTERMSRWHPLNRSLYMGYKTILPGLLMNHKGDRVAMANSVETRYPFLDEQVIDFCSRISPSWKLKGLMHDKRILRAMASNYLPSEVANRPKAMFRAPFGDTLFEGDSTLTKQLLSQESLEKTGYFDPARVQQAIQLRSAKSRLPGRRLFDEMGLTAVFATQLWHHRFFGGGLCDLPVPSLYSRTLNAQA